MYIFILESIGTQELILIGIIALVVFGPRKMPEMARKLGSMMNEFKKISGEFKSTWENAVDLDNLEDTKKIETTNVSREIENSIGQVETKQTNGSGEIPEVRKVSKEEFDEMVAEREAEVSMPNSEDVNIEKVTPTKTEPTASDKTNWL